MIPVILVRPRRERRQIEELLEKLATTQDYAAAPEFRGVARQLLGMGECDPWQDCPFRGGCKLCGKAGK